MAEVRQNLTLDENVTYVARVRTVSGLGVASPWSDSLVINTVANLSGIAIPLGVKASPNVRSIILQWIPNSALNFDHVEVYVSSTSFGLLDPDPAYLYGEAKASIMSINRFFDPDGATPGFYDLLPGTPYYIKMRAVSNTGATSPFTGEIASTTGFVGNDDIAAGTILGEKIVAGSLDADRITAGTITGEQIQAGSITANEINVGTLPDFELTPGIIQGTHIANGQIATAHLIANQIDIGAIGLTNSITGSSTILAANAIKGTHISDGIIVTEHIVAGGIAASVITSGTMSGQRITAGTISSGHIDTTGLSAAHIKFGSMDGDRITANTLSGDRIEANTINGNRIIADTFEGHQIKANSITAEVLQTGSVTTDKLDANAVTAAKIQAGAVDAAELKAGVIVITGSQGIRSSSFSSGNNGWQVLANGAAEFNSINLQGTITREDGSGAGGYIWMKSKSNKNVWGMHMVFSKTINSGTGAYSSNYGGGHSPWGELFLSPVFNDPLTATALSLKSWYWDGGSTATFWMENSSGTRSNGFVGFAIGS